MSGTVKAGRAATCVDIAAAIGCSKAHVQNIERRGIERLKSAHHRAAVETRLRRALDELIKLRTGGASIATQWWAAVTVDELCDALTWLDRLHEGDFEDYITGIEEESEWLTLEAS